MSEARRQRLAELLQRERRSKLVPDMVARWAELGVAVSSVADRRHGRLEDALRGGKSWPLDYTPDHVAAVRAFCALHDIIVICGWDVAEEPIVLIAAADLTREADKLTSVYRDGFVMSDPSFASGLTVDWDDDGQCAYAGTFKLGNNAQD